MTMEEFRRSSTESMHRSLLALWWEVQGNWEKAHEVASEVKGSDGAKVHAYLHRREGDASNAAYWYRRAGAPVRMGDLDAERDALVAEMSRAPTAL